MAVFPFLQKIDDKQFLVVGDGAIARRKAKLLCLFTDQVTLLTDRADRDESISLHKLHIQEEEAEAEEKAGLEVKVGPEPEEKAGPEPEEKAGPEPEAASLQNSPAIVRHRFCPADLEKVDFCIASTDDSGRNHWIAALCRETGIPVNVPDAPSLCTFYLPSVIKKGDLTVAVSTNGKSPAFSARLRREIDRILPSETEEILNRMGELREWAAENIPETGTRSELYHSILTELLLGELPPETEAVLRRACTWPSLSGPEHSLSDKYGRSIWSSDD